MQRDTVFEATLVAKYVVMAPLLNECTRRLWAAAESVAIGFGGDAVVSAATGLARKTTPDTLLRWHGVVARILTGPHDANRQDSHLPMRYDTGRPRAVIRLRISQPSGQ